MAKGSDVAQPLANEGEGLEQGTPIDAADDSALAGDKKGVHLAQPRKVIVGDYEERPYSTAITREQLERLEAAGQAPE